MDFGFVLPSTGPLASEQSLLDTAVAAEAAGFASLWVSDHVVLPTHVESPYPYSPDGRMAWRPGDGWLEPLTALTLVATATDHVRLGTAVLVLPQREPLLVAKQTATVDLLSDGRLTLGVGAGWMAEEFGLLGHSFADRGPRMNEMITVLRNSWTGDEVTFQGEFYQHPAYRQTPAPKQGTHIPILIGGHSHAACARAAALGDGWIPSNLAPNDVRAGLRHMRDIAGSHQRELAGFEVAVRPGKRRYPLTAHDAEQYAEAGTTTLILEVDHRLAPSTRDVVEGLQEMARVMLLKSRVHAGASGACSDIEGCPPETT